MNKEEYKKIMSKIEPANDLLNQEFMKLFENSEFNQLFKNNNN